MLPKVPSKINRLCQEGDLNSRHVDFQSWYQGYLPKLLDLLYADLHHLYTNWKALNPYFFPSAPSLLGSRSLIGYDLS
jgi:hypothetical protein